MGWAAKLHVGSLGQSSALLVFFFLLKKWFRVIIQILHSAARRQAVMTWDLHRDVSPKRVCRVKNVNGCLCNVDDHTFLRNQSNNQLAVRIF